MTRDAPLDAAMVDRVRELTSIGAGHAANALAQMLGRTCQMRVPTVAPLRAAPETSSEGDDGDAAGDRMGVFFELEGGPGGAVALIFPAPVGRKLVELLLGEGPFSDEQAESALRELGNILVSHVASSIADATGSVVVPSLPTLAMHDASAVWAAQLDHRAQGGAGLRIETEIADRSREIHGRLVFVPDRVEPAPGPPGGGVEVGPGPV